MYQAECHTYRKRILWRIVCNMVSEGLEELGIHQGFRTDYVERKKGRGGVRVAFL